MSAYSNMSGVTTVGRATPREPTQRLGVDVRLEQRERRVVAALRVGGEAPARRHDRARAVSYVPRSVVMIGSVDAEAVDQAVDRRRAAGSGR